MISKDPVPVPNSAFVDEAPCLTAAQSSAIAAAVAVSSQLSSRETMESVPPTRPSCATTTGRPSNPAVTPTQTAYIVSNAPHHGWHNALQAHVALDVADAHRGFRQKVPLTSQCPALVTLPVLADPAVDALFTHRHCSTVGDVEDAALQSHALHHLIRRPHFLRTNRRYRRQNPGPHDSLAAPSQIAVAFWTARWRNFGCSRVVS